MATNCNEAANASLAMPGAIDPPTAMRSKASSHQYSAWLTVHVNCKQGHTKYLAILVALTNKYLMIWTENKSSENC